MNPKLAGKQHPKSSGKELKQKNVERTPSHVKPMKTANTFERSRRPVIKKPGFKIVQ